MTSQTSISNVAINSCKQPSNSVSVDGSRTYWERIILNIPNQKNGQTSEAVMAKLKQANNHDKRIQNYYM